MAAEESVSRVAIIGGGVTGATCALELVRLTEGRAKVTVFDQGRGLGGRCCHRRVVESGDVVGPDTPTADYLFDHGCQFFRADSDRFCQELLQKWLDRGWAAAWSCRFGALKDPLARLDELQPDFFGVPTQLPVYCGVGGMNALPIGMLEEAAGLGAALRPGVRVAAINRLSSGTWLLSGTTGQAAFHDTKEEDAARASPDSLGEFDVIVVTDVSASMGAWHRASAGVPEAIASQVRGRTRVVLFTALFAFESRLQVPLDAIAFSDETLWFAARTSSKPGLDGAGKLDCWTLVSTPKYAAAEIDRVPMQDPKTGAFRPQEMSYIREGPCAVLLAAFERILRTSGHASCLPMPRAAYVGGQRWGSAFPAPAGVGGRDVVGRGASTVEVLNVAYDAAPAIELAPGSESGHKVRGGKTRDFLADDEDRIYYAGDYVSSGLPGVESAALSGLDVARHLAAELGRGSRAEALQRCQEDEGRPAKLARTA